MRTLGVLIALVVLALPAQAQSLAAKLDASRVAARAEIALAEDAELRAFEFQASVRDDVLTLRGRVDTTPQRERAAALVTGLAGVESVVNEVVVGGNTAALGTTELPPAPVDSVAAPSEEADAEPETVAEPQEVYHTVRRGDTLGAIARRYGVSVREIQRLNGLSGTRIRGGQRLRVK